MSEMLPPLDVVLSNPRRFGREGDIWSPPEQWMSGDHFAVVSPRDNAIVPCMSVGELIVQEGGITSSQTEKSGHTGDQLRTGFLARMDCNGAIQSQGFTYTQEGRINQRLENLPVVRDAALVLLPASTADPEDLVAFVTLKSGSNPEQHEQVKTDVCEALQTTFSILLQPDQVCVIDRIPYTKVGRLNKRRFRSLYNSSYADTPSSYSVEWSPTASSIRAAFQKVSGAPVKDIRPHTTIFRLGLDSISAVQVAMSLRETWSSITLADIMQHPTCNSLAKAIDQRALRSRQNGVSAPKVDFPSFEDRYKIQLCTSLKIPESSVAEILPCTPMQDGILSEFLQSSKGLYCNKITLKLLSKYSVADIRAAMSSVTKVHLMLRTGFAQTDDHQHPFTMLCYAASFAAADNLQSNLTEPQDWGRSIVGEIRNGLQRPPWRMLIYEREDQRYIDLVILHALYDAHSLQLILNDFSRALRGQSMSAESDIKIVLKEILQASHCHSKEQRSFWTSQAESLRIAHFPNMNPLQEYEQSFVTLSRQVSRSRAELEDACKEAEFTIQAAAQASWARLLSAYLGEDQVTFGVVFSGRSSVQAESACFPCVTTLPYSSPVSPRNRDILQSAMNYNSAVRMFQFVPLSRIQRWSGHSREALFDTILAYQRNTVKSVDWPWLLAEEYSPTDVSTPR